MRLTGKTFFVVMLTTMLSACGSNQAPTDTVQLKIQEMVSSKFSAYKSANIIPENAGLLLHLLTPSGTWTVSANVPAGSGANTHYRIASVTKTFTAAAIMLLDQQGKLKIDDSVTSLIPGTAIPYLPDSPDYRFPYKNLITIRQLLSHLAGVFDVSNDLVPADKNVPYAGDYYLDYIMNTLKDPLHQFNFDELARVNSLNELCYWAPGTAHHYSNTGYTLLAKIIERVSGKSYDRFIADNFFGPMGLKDTSAPWNSNDRTLPSPYLKGYSRQESNVAFVDTTEDNMSPNVGEGNVISSPADAARWMRMLISGQGPLTNEQVTRMTTVPAANESSAYALGVAVTPIGIGHNGAHPGYLNIVVYNPLDDVAAVVVLSYTDFSDLARPVPLLVEIITEARKIAGYTATLPRQ
jgi:D-alanyl-D-alanine carboxypeptidase